MARLHGWYVFFVVVELIEYTIYTRASCIYSVKGETVEYQKKELILTFAPLSLLSPLSVSSSSVCFPFFVVHTSPHIDCE